MQTISADYVLTTDRQNSSEVHQCTLPIPSLTVVRTPSTKIQTDGIVRNIVANMNMT
jgi:hypothetical protein